MPAIKTPTLADHRDWRRSQLIEAAAAIALVLLDEPFASQDLVSQESLIEHFKEERRKGRTILLVAHREKNSLAWCDQIINLS